MSKQEFVPCTMARAIGDGVLFRPIKSWHSGSYAGEKLERVPGREDRSGCLYDVRVHGSLHVCAPPLSVTHRLYWHEADPAKTVSVFLSYPDGMGCSDEYFWEAYGIDPEDVKRYFGENAEAEMESDVKNHFTKRS